MSALGASLVVISPELPKRTADMAAKQKLTFPILWDEQSKVAEAFGLAFVLPDDLRQGYLRLCHHPWGGHRGPAWRPPPPSPFFLDAQGNLGAGHAGPPHNHP